MYFTFYLHLLKQNCSLLFKITQKQIYSSKEKVGWKKDPKYDINYSHVFILVLSDYVVYYIAYIENYKTKTADQTNECQNKIGFLALKLRSGCPWVNVT